MDKISVVVSKVNLIKEPDEKELRDDRADGSLHTFFRVRKESFSTLKRKQLKTVDLVP